MHFTICGCEMEVWIFDRSGPYSPGPFDIHDEPERFIQVIAGYSMMNEEELGLDTFMERDVDGCFVTLDRNGAESPTKMLLEPRLVTHRRAIVCRGTSCFLTNAPRSKGHDCVTKFSWTSDRRRPEANLLRLARQRGVKGIANLVAHRRITDVAEFRLDIWRALFLPRSTECGIIVFAVFFAISTAQFPFWVIKQAPWLERRPESVEKAEIGQDWKKTLL